MTRVSTALLVFVLSSISSPSSSPAGDERPANVRSAAGVEPSVALEVLPRGVYRRGEVLLRANLRPRQQASYAWEAQRGKLLSEEGPEVLWEAPDRAGKVRVEVKVRVASSRQTLRAKLEIDVLEPSTKGMVRIRGGVFTMGNTWTDLDDPNFVVTSQNKADKPAHLVKISPYWMDRDRVTNRRYVAFLESALEEGLLEISPIAVLGLHRGSMVPFYRFSYDDLAADASKPPLRGIIRWDDQRFRIRPGHEDHPVVDVTWPGANAFARYYGKRLPTEAQWELAARGKDGRLFPWGNDLPSPRHANVNEFFGDRLFPVGTFSPHGDSPYGVHEMVGGIFEWCNDWYNADYYSDTYSEEPIEDPRGPHWGKDHALRGVPATQGLNGSEHEQPPLSFRYTWFFEFPIGDGFANGETGFRCAADDDPSAKATGPDG